MCVCVLLCFLVVCVVGALLLLFVFSFLFLGGALALKNQPGLVAKPSGTHAHDPMDSNGIPLVNMLGSVHQDPKFIIDC